MTMNINDFPFVSLSATKLGNDLYEIQLTLLNSSDSNVKGIARLIGGDPKILLLDIQEGTVEPGDPIVFDPVTVDFFNFEQKPTGEDVTNVLFTSVQSPLPALAGHFLIKKGKYPPPVPFAPLPSIRFDDYIINELKLERTGNDINVNAKFQKLVAGIPDLSLHPDSPEIKGTNEFYYFQEVAHTASIFTVSFLINGYFTSPINTIVLGGKNITSDVKKWLRFKWDE